MKFYEASSRIDMIKKSLPAMKILRPTSFEKGKDVKATLGFKAKKC